MKEKKQPVTWRPEKSVQAKWTPGTRTLQFIVASERGFPGGASGKEPACQCRRHKGHGFDPWVRKKGPLEEGTATHSSILAWRIPWTEEPGRLQSIGLQRIGHDWNNLTRMHTPYRYLYFSLKGGFWWEEPILQSKGGDFLIHPLTNIHWISPKF